MRRSVAQIGLTRPAGNRNRSVSSINSRTEFLSRRGRESRTGHDLIRCHSVGRAGGNGSAGCMNRGVCGGSGLPAPVNVHDTSQCSTVVDPCHQTASGWRVCAPPRRFVSARCARTRAQDGLDGGSFYSADFGVRSSAPMPRDDLGIRGCRAAARDLCRRCKIYL